MCIIRHFLKTLSNRKMNPYAKKANLKDFRAALAVGVSKSSKATPHGIQLRYWFKIQPEDLPVVRAVFEARSPTVDPALAAWSTLRKLSGSGTC